MAPQLETNCLPKGRIPPQRHEFVVAGEGKEIVYVGEAVGLYHNGSGYVSGRAVLSRYDQGTEVRRVPRFKPAPPFVRLEPVHYRERERVWRVGGYYDRLVHDPRRFVIFPRNSEQSYRSSLQDTARLKGIILSDELLCHVFDPIEQSIQSILEGEKRPDTPLVWLDPK